MNDCLQVGSVVPFVKWAAAQRYSAVVVNPNLSHDPRTQVRMCKEW